mmetsp:Transcript_11187/g.33538  ORF Transcript_11187/g.33538 Transcript_11187/m.33538 type:complete len:576 (-) Transcript_11187:466-2193(-)
MLLALVLAASMLLCDAKQKGSVAPSTFRSCVEDCGRVPYNGASCSIQCPQRCQGSTPCCISQPVNVWPACMTRCHELLDCVVVTAEPCTPSQFCAATGVTQCTAKPTCCPAAWGQSLNTSNPIPTSPLHVRGSHDGAAADGALRTASDSMSLLTSSAKSQGKVAVQSRSITEWRNVTAAADTFSECISKCGIFGRAPHVCSVSCRSLTCHPLNSECCKNEYGLGRSYITCMAACHRQFDCVDHQCAPDERCISFGRIQCDPTYMCGPPSPPTPRECPPPSPPAYSCDNHDSQCAVVPPGGQYPTLGDCKAGCAFYNCDADSLQCVAVEAGQRSDFSNLTSCKNDCVSFNCDRSRGQCIAVPYGQHGDFKSRSTCEAVCQSYKCDHETLRCEAQRSGLPGFGNATACEADCIGYRCDLNTTLQCVPEPYGKIPTYRNRTSCTQGCVSYTCNSTAGQCLAGTYGHPGLYNSSIDCESACRTYACNVSTMMCDLQPYGSPPGYDDLRRCEDECVPYKCDNATLRCLAGQYGHPGMFPNATACTAACREYECYKDECYALPYGTPGPFKSLSQCEAACP